MVVVERLIIDLIVLLLGFVGVGFVIRAKIAGRKAISMWILGVGILLLGVNHLMDTIFLAEWLGPTMGPLVHRANNLIGFVLMTVGFWSLSKSA